MPGLMKRGEGAPACNILKKLLEERFHKARKGKIEIQEIEDPFRNEAEGLPGWLCSMRHQEII